MTHVLSIDTPDSAIVLFRSPMPWKFGTMTPTINGRTRTEGYVEMNAWTIRFDEPPRVGDVVGFFLTPAVT